MKTLVIGCVLAGLIALSAKPEARVPSPVATPGTVDPQPRTEVGLASWYGDERYKKPTASGEVFDKKGLTAAHRTLPMGAKIKVTNLKNKRSVILRVNDRGPGIASRIVDISMAAAQKLGFVTAGIALVEVMVIPQPTR